MLALDMRGSEHPVCPRVLTLPPPPPRIVYPPPQVQQRTATALARLAPFPELRRIFIERNGLDILCDMLQVGPAAGSSMCSMRDVGWHWAAEIVVRQACVWKDCHTLQ